MSFLGHKAIVTGGSRGIGYEIAKKLANLGCSVSLISRDERLLKKNINSLSIIYSNQKHNYLKFDLQKLLNYDKKSSSYLELLKFIENTSILINSAAITNSSLLVESKNADIVSTIEINLTSPIILSKLLIKPMLRLANSNIKKSFKIRITPTILNISSLLSLANFSVYGTSVYSASKAGLLGLTISLASELKNKIRINALLPGLVHNTGMSIKNKNKNDLPIVLINDLVDSVIKILVNENVNGQCFLLNNKSLKPLNFF